MSAKKAYQIQSKVFFLHVKCDKIGKNSRALLTCCQYKNVKKNISVGVLKRGRKEKSFDL